LPIHAEWISYGKGIRERGRLATRDLLTRWPEITAVFAYNDLLAIGAIRACRELGRRVPQDCAVIGFDDIPLADMTAPALTTVRIKKYELGQLAMTRLIAMLNDPTATFEPICSDVELVVRESA
jgi:LacI family transcriptional regulator